MKNSSWGSLICTSKTFMFHFIFFTLPSLFWVSSGKVSSPLTYPSIIPFCFSTVGKLLTTHKILGVRILALHNLGKPPHYTASSFQLFEILLHLQAYVEAKPGSKCAYITLLFLEYQQPEG